jgi:hypothetical protein
MKRNPDINFVGINLFLGNAKNKKARLRRLFRIDGTLEFINGD